MGQGGKLKTREGIGDAAHGVMLVLAVPVYIAMSADIIRDTFNGEVRWVALLIVLCGLSLLRRKPVKPTPFLGQEVNITVNGVEMHAVWDEAESVYKTTKRGA